MGLASCAAPKADIVVEEPQNQAQATALANPDTSPVSLTETKPNLPKMRNTGLRLPDVLNSLPQDDQLRSAPSTPNDGKATVIARPPEE